MDLSSFQSRVSSSFPPHRTQLHTRLIQYPNPIPKPSPNNYRNRRFILVSSLLLLPFLFYIFSTALAVHRSPKFSEPKRNLFGVVISAGPLGSRVHVYEFIGNLRLNWVDLSSTNVRPGLGMFSRDPEGAGRSIKRLILFAKERIPRSEWRDTKVLLIASEELEKLTLDARNAVMESCRRVLRSSGFLFKNDWAEIVRDQEEAIYAWVAANYAHGVLGVEAQETTGIVELGGNSMQVVFSNRDPQSLQPLRLIKFGGITYKLYIQTTSFLGQDAAWKALHDLRKSKGSSGYSISKETAKLGPCIPRGYDRNSSESNIKPSSAYMLGNFSTCKSQAMTLLKTRGECIHQPCEMTLYSFQLPGKHVQNGKFIFISEFFGMVNKGSLSELERAGHHYCEEDWPTLKMQHSNIDDLDLVKHCFSSAYLTAILLLHNNTLSSISVDDHNKFRSAAYYNTTGRIRSPVDWTLGAFVVQTMSEPLEIEAKTNNQDEIIGSDAVTFFSLFALLLVVVLISLFIIKRQKPKVRTIYDLEKGRYIITQLHGKGGNIKK